MKKAPYTLAEAQDIYAQYAHLAGQHYSNGKDITIDKIAIAPFDQVSKNKFIIYYLICGDAQFALQNEYRGMLYDVIVIASFRNDQQFLYEDIHTWLEKNSHAVVVQPLAVAAHL